MISVIVPVYNTEKYLHRCVDSILSQTFADFELLLVNDGSIDGSGAICDEYAQKDSRVRVFHKENGGVSSARNFGLDNALGEYVMFVDSDDYIYPQMCKIMAESIQAMSVDLVVCGTEETGGGYWKPQKDEIISISELKNNFSYYVTTELLSPPWNKIFKRDNIRNKFRADMSFGEDLVFNLNYLETCKKIAFITESPFFHEKENNQSLVVSVNRRRLIDIENIWIEIDDFLGGTNCGINSKYFRDLLVYSRQLLKTVRYNWNQKNNILNDWYKDARLRRICVDEYNENITNKVLLFALKYGMWRLADKIVNWRNYLKLK